MLIEKFWLRQDLQDDQDSCCFFPFPDEREKDNPPSAETMQFSCNGGRMGIDDLRLIKAQR